MQRTADFHDQIADADLPEAIGVMDDAAALDATVDVLDPDPATGDAPMGPFLGAREGPTPWLLGGHDDLDVVECDGQAAEILEQPAPRGYGVASAMRLSWVLPAYVSLRKRIVSAVLISNTFFSVGHLFLPRS